LVGWRWGYAGNLGSGNVGVPVGIWKNFDGILWLDFDSVNFRVDIFGEKMDR
jgi:hypothetical protein